MIVALLVLVLRVSLARDSVAASLTLFQSPRDVVDCTEWRECRQLALAAADRGAYETFHDLAWRAVQTGPPGDPALMYLVARAQSLSGRPHDALVMLRRLAELGFGSDAATNEDFSRTRQLSDWPEVAARVERISGPGSPPSVADPSAPFPAAAPAGRPTVPTTVPAATTAAAGEAVRFSAERLTVSGLAYDAVSHRFLFGDRFGRKLIVVGEGTNYAVDLVRADSAGFQEISAIEIDAKRGDLWVASAAAADGAGTLHRLQLVSGRQLRSFRVAGDPHAVKLVDLAVSPAGAVLVLDARANHFLPRGAQRRINVYAVVRHELARMAWPRSTHHRRCCHHRHQTEGNATRRSHPTDGRGTTRSLGARHHPRLPRVSSTFRRLTRDSRP